MRVRLLTLFIAANLLASASLLLNPAKLAAGEVLRYDCTTQTHQAFENECLSAFTKETDIPIQLNIFPSYATVYRHENEYADTASTAAIVEGFQQEPGFKETALCKDPLAIVTHFKCLVSNRIKPLAVSSTTTLRSLDELIIDDQVLEIVLRGAEQNQTLLFSSMYSSSPADMNRIEIERIIVLDLLPALRVLGYHDLWLTRRLDLANTKSSFFC